MYIVRYRLPSGDFSEMVEARMLSAITVALEFHEAGHGDITIRDGSDGFVQGVDWWETIEPAPPDALSARTQVGQGSPPCT